MQQNRHESFFDEVTAAHEEIKPIKPFIGRKSRILVIAAVLLALFLGALDALVVGAAMPTVVADLGGLHLYSWVFSAYLLTRSISLPIFGKLCDLFSSKKLYVIAIVIFVVSSVLAGAANNMLLLIVFRALQGIGAGGTFALAYIVVADLSPPQERGKMMGLISFVWGVASVVGPAVGGFIVTYSSWRWIFYINLPLGSLALLGVILYLQETREKKREASVDVLGAVTLSLAALALLTSFLLAGRSYKWLSPQTMGLFAVTLCAGIAFYLAEKRAREPVLAIDFFRSVGFSMGNGAAFFSSFAIFSLSAFIPLFIQGALGKSPAELGIAMIPLSLGWSGGALVCGRLVNRMGEKPLSVLGSLLLMASTAAALSFSPSTPLAVCSIVFAVSGIGMGFVSIGTLLIVQNSLEASDLGVATSSHQFARTLGGTIGIGISGSLVTAYLMQGLDSLNNPALQSELPSSVLAQLTQNVEQIFHPQVQSILSTGIQKALQEAVGRGVDMVFWASLAASFISLLFCYLLPKKMSG